MSRRIWLAGARRRRELRRQRRSLARVLAAARSLPGYRRHLADWAPGDDPYAGLRMLPVLERDAVQDHPAAYHHPGVRSLALTSSGSTGVPLSLSLDRRARWRRRRQYGLFFLTQRLAAVAPVGQPQARRRSLRAARLGDPRPDGALTPRRSSRYSSPSTVSSRPCVRADPEILHGLPSALEQIAIRAHATGWRPRGLRRIFTVSEALTPATRELLESALGAPVLDSYAASEALVGWECGRGRGHPRARGERRRRGADRRRRAGRPGRGRPRRDHGPRQPRDAAAALRDRRPRPGAERRALHLRSRRHPDPARPRPAGPDVRGRRRARLALGDDRPHVRAPRRSASSSSCSRPPTASSR